MNPKVQPHNLEAEQSVLGAAFISKSALQKVCEDLMPESFFIDSHSKIFEYLILFSSYLSYTLIYLIHP